MSFALNITYPDLGSSQESPWYNYDVYDVVNLTWVLRGITSSFPLNVWIALCGSQNTNFSGNETSLIDANDTISISLGELPLGSTTGYHLFNLSWLQFPQKLPACLPCVCQFAFDGTGTIQDSPRSGFFNLLASDGNPAVWNNIPPTSILSATTSITSTSRVITVTSTLNPPTDTAISTSTDATAEKVGIGLVIPLAIVLISIIILLVLRCRKGDTRPVDDSGVLFSKSGLKVQPPPGNLAEKEAMVEIDEFSKDTTAV